MRQKKTVPKSPKEKLLDWKIFVDGLVSLVYNGHELEKEKVKNEPKSEE